MIPACIGNAKYGNIITILSFKIAEGARTKSMPSKASKFSFNFSIFADHDFKAVNYTSLIVIFIIMIFVLKRISLPIILILTIEFAIFLNMSMAYQSYLFLYR
mgnify:CR=1 FL=1